jgi:hypothetical protein
MATVTVEEIYEQAKQLSAAERLRLASLITGDLAATAATETPPKRSILELEGLGKEIWEGIDAQEYVNELRKEWDHRP